MSNKSKLIELFRGNELWAKKHIEKDPDFFNLLAKEQNPQYLWVGCSDSRVPAEDILGVLPGEVFVHRNVANIVHHTDFSLLSVLQFAVEILGIRKILVVGHYGCGGIRAAISPHTIGLADNWLRSITELFRQHEQYLNKIPHLNERADILSKANVYQQVANIAATTIVQQAWAQHEKVEVHGLIFNLANGLLEDLDLCVSQQGELPDVYERLRLLFQAPHNP